MKRTRILTRRKADDTVADSFPVAPAAPVQRVLDAMAAHMDHDRFYLEAEEYDDGKDEYP